MKKLIITGANGQLGRAIAGIYDNNPEYELIKTDVVKADIEDVKLLDITSIDSLIEEVRNIKPYAILNCAAYTAVDACETNEDLAYKINAIGPRNLAIAASEANAKLMHISTDYVFDGMNRDKPYTEYDATAPKSAYGRTKLAGEEYVRQFADKYYILRTAWLYGEGKNFARTMLKLSENHDRITVVNDQVGSPTSAKELAKCMNYLLPTDNYGLFHATCEGSCSWADFAAEVLRLADSKTEIVPVTTQEYKEMNPASADRPAYSILDNYVLRLTSDYMFADWKDAIREYMSK